MSRTPFDYLLLALAGSAFLTALALAQTPALAQAPAPSKTAAPAAATAPPRASKAQVFTAAEKARAGDVAPLLALAETGDPEAQAALGNAYFGGIGGKTDMKRARQWYEKAAAQKHPQATRTLGEMWAKGQGGKKDVKKATKLWIEAEKLGDPLAPTLVADKMFSDITAGRQPGTGQYAFKGGIPAGDVDVAIDWYKEALKRDPRPDARKRAEVALNALEVFKSAAQVKVDKK